MFIPPLAPSYSNIPIHYTGLLYARAQQGKVAELRLELNSGGGKKDKNFLTKRVALKKVVANMTMSNNDMIALFPDIIGCMGIPNAEIKKMYDNPVCWGEIALLPDEEIALWTIAKLVQVLLISRELRAKQARYCY